MSKPIKFGLNYNKNKKKIIIQLPLVFYNNGAADIIVNNLRLKVLSDNNDEAVLFFNNTFRDLESNEERQWGYAFAVGGRNSQSRVFVFMKTSFEFIIPDGLINATLEAQINNKQKWLKLLDMDLSTPKKHHETMHTILKAYDC